MTIPARPEPASLPPRRHWLSPKQLTGCLASSPLPILERLSLTLTPSPCYPRGVEELSPGTAHVRPGFPNSPAVPKTRNLEAGPSTMLLSWCEAHCHCPATFPAWVWPVPAPIPTATAAVPSTPHTVQGLSHTLHCHYGSKVLCGHPLSGGAEERPPKQVLSSGPGSGSPPRGADINWVLRLRASPPLMGSLGGSQALRLQMGKLSLAWPLQPMTSLLCLVLVVVCF